MATTKEPLTFENAIALTQSLLSQVSKADWAHQSFLEVASRKAAPTTLVSEETSETPAVNTGKISDAEIGAQITELVKTENGARGFFVTYLTSNSPLADNPSDAVIQALRSSPEVVAELLVKNLAMSTAQELFHCRRQAEEMAQGSQQVQVRTANLIQLLGLEEVKVRSQQLIDTATTGEGKYKAFLERWNYDFEQKQLICTALQQATSP